MRAAFVAVVITIAAALIGGAFVYFGAYNVAATEQHWAVTYHLLDTAMRRSVRQRSKDVVVPPLADPALQRHGASLYRQHCAQCHGAPGVAPEPFALGLIPAPANLVHTARTWQTAELYWVVKHGIKTTGMPAWTYRLPDDDLWAIVAFLQRLPMLMPDEYRALAQHERKDSSAAPPNAYATPGDPERGKQAIQQYACTTCHRIDGVVGANAPVGPPLSGIATRGFLAGTLPNTPENMVRWLQTPQEVNPRSAMPTLGVTRRDAQDIAAYLYTLK